VYRRQKKGEFCPGSMKKRGLQEKEVAVESAVKKRARRALEQLNGQGDIPDVSQLPEGKGKGAEINIAKS